MQNLTCPAQVALDLFNLMRTDNDLPKVDDLSALGREGKKLESLVARSLDEGLPTDADTLLNIAAGDVDEVEKTFGHIRSFGDLSEHLNSLFDSICGVP